MNVVQCLAHPWLQEQDINNGVIKTEKKAEVQRGYKGRAEDVKK